MRRFEFTEGTSNKFWEVLLAGSKLTTRWGKIGGSINQRVHELASAEAARKEHDKLVREKTTKGYREVGGNGAPPPANKPAAAAKPSGIAPTELVAKLVREPAGYGRLGRVVIDGRRVLLGGDRTTATTDGKTFHARSHPGTVFAMTVVDGVVYTCGGPLAMSRDLGATWQEIKVPAPGYRFAIARDSQGTWWLGCDDGLVLTSKRPDGGWKKAPFKGYGKVLWICEIDGKLLCGGADSGVWDGKKYTRLKGMKKSDVVTRIVETPAGTLVAVGDGAIAYRSTDRGASWQPVKVPASTAHDLEDFAWVAGALVVVGSGGLILRSTNDGKSFTKVKSPTTQKLWGIASWGDGALICGDRGVIVQLASPKDTFWRGAKDELAPPPPEIDRTFAPLAAKDREADYKRQLRDAVAAYTPTKDTRPADPNPELARLIEADVDGASDNLAIYADWLQGRGDPRGELAAIQLKRDEAPKDKTLAKAEKALLASHAAALLGPFAELADVVTLEWRGGFIHAARLANSLYRSSYGEGTKETEIDVAELVAKLLDHPSARFLRDLTVGIVEYDENSYDEVAKLIGKRHLPALRTLYLGDFDYDDTELSWSHLGNMQPLYAALPNLRTLRLRSGSMQLGKIVHPTLEHFEVTTGGLDPKAAKAIATAVWPSLRHLSLMGGQERYGGTTTVKDLRPILAGDNLPRLRHLGLRNLEYTDDVIEPLATSKLLPQLAEVDLSLGTLSDDGVRRLYRYQKAFQHLERLDVSDNYISKTGLKLLRTLNIPLEEGRQRDDEGDPENRYASLGE